MTKRKKQKNDTSLCRIRRKKRISKGICHTFSSKSNTSERTRMAGKVLNDGLKREIGKKSLLEKKFRNVVRVKEEDIKQFADMKVIFFWSQDILLSHIIKWDSLIFTARENIQPTWPVLVSGRHFVIHCANMLQILVWRPIYHSKQVKIIECILHYNVTIWSWIINNLGFTFLLNAPSCKIASMQKCKSDHSCKIDPSCKNYTSCKCGFVH